MTEFLMKIARGKMKPDDPTLRERYGYLGSIIGIIINLLLFIMKLIVGILVRSISVKADAFNNLSDTLSSVITLAGFRLASQPADEDHPYGHGRIEYFSGLVVSVLVLYVGIQFLVSSIQKIIHPEILEFRWIPIILFIISIGSKIWLSSFNRHLGEKIDSSALKASALDARGDVMISSTVVIGLLLSHFTGLNLDGYAGLFVALMIIKNAWELISETVNPLLGEKVDEELIEKIEGRLLEKDEIFGIHDTVIHNYGPGRYLGSTHVEVRKDISVIEIHDIIDAAENEIHRTMGVDLVCHMDPVWTEDPVEKQMIKKIREAVLEIEGITDIHDMRFREKLFIGEVVVDPSRIKTQEDHVLLTRKSEEAVKRLYPEIEPDLTFDLKNILI